DRNYFMSWTKALFKKEIDNIISCELKKRSYKKKSRLYFKKLSLTYADISYQITLNDCQKTEVGFHFWGTISLDEINNFLKRFYKDDRNFFPIMTGNIGLFTPANTNKSYYFNWERDYTEQLNKFLLDLSYFESLVENIKEVKDLSLDNLKKIPFIRKNFSEGLSKNYKFCHPSVEAAINFLNGNFEEAILLAKEQVKNDIISLKASFGLSDEGKKQLERELQYSENLLAFFESMYKNKNG
ncbi:hypothetical protein, partial [Gilliamella sp. wkB112]|uniref:hypothetical protein n=2 Tax=Gilliamella sp. wkB112 TaxID=3120257 RepID=UPI001C3FF6B2